MPPRLIDTHCHLDAAEFDTDRAAVHTRAVAAGVVKIVVPAVERANFGAVASVCREFDSIPAFGVHPLYVAQALDEDLAALRAMLADEPAAAVGEIGLDYFVAPRDEALQERWFVAQLELAREFNLPVLLHVRRAVDAVLKHLRRIPVPGGIAHAFNGSRQQADEFIKLGFKLGFGGAFTYPRARNLRELAATLPLSALVLETDAPDMPPAWLAHKTNEPAALQRIAIELAALRRIDMQTLTDALANNTYSALPRLSRPFL